MIESLQNLPPGYLTTLVCLFFVGLTWFGAIFIRPILRALVHLQGDINGVLGNFVSIYGIFYGILMGLLAVAAYQNKVDIEEALTTEGVALFAYFRNISAYPEGVRQPMLESARDYTRFVIDAEWPQMRRGEHATGGMPLINHMQELLTAFKPGNAGEVILHTEATRQFYRFLEMRALRLLSAQTGIPGFMWYVVTLGALLSIFLVWLFDMSLLAHIFLGGLMSFFVGTMISLILILDRPLMGGYGIEPVNFQLLLNFMNNVLGQPAG
jgi:hypothetical protein